MYSIQFNSIMYVSTYVHMYVCMDGWMQAGKSVQLFNSKICQQ